MRGEMPMKKPVILDCDPGHDDAIAIFMALASEKLDVKAITTSAGNQTPEKTFQNARKLLALAGREDVEVARGALGPLKRNLIIADDVHGETGLDGANLPLPTVQESKRKAIDVMAEVISNSKEKVTIIPTGPLTNIAIFLLAYPELKSKIELISLMGGACFGGNYTPNAEFNIYVDPEAADIVFRSRVPIAMFGLDVTLKAQFFEEDINRVRSLGTRTGVTMAGLLDFFSKTTTKPLLADPEHIEGLHMHDPCAVAYVIDPTLFTMIEANVEVVTTDGPTLGSTVVDYNNTTNKTKNTLVGFDLDCKRLTDLIYLSLAKFN